MKPTTTTSAQSIVYTPRGFVFTIEDTGLLTATTLPVTLSRPAGEKTPEVSHQYGTVEQAKSWADAIAEGWAVIYGEPVPTAPVEADDFGDPFAEEPTAQAIAAKHPQLFAAAQFLDARETCPLTAAQVLIDAAFVGVDSLLRAQPDNAKLKSLWVQLKDIEKDAYKAAQAEEGAPATYETPEFCAFMEREMNSARTRFFAQTEEKREQIAAWNRWATSNSAPLTATITGSGTHWHVHAPGRSHSGFGSKAWAEAFCRNMGYTIAEQPA